MMLPENSADHSAREFAAEFRSDIEDRLRVDPSRPELVRRFLFRALGALTVGTFSAGFSIFALVIVLNLVFHFNPE